jgi:hypothetical protein
MPKFKVEIRTTGAAFCDENGEPDDFRAGEEIDRIMREECLPYVKEGVQTGTLRDANGNTCGLWWSED